MEEGKCLFFNRKYQLDLFWPFCPDCHEPLLYTPPPQPRDFNLKKTTPLERFIDFLPLGQINKSLSLGEGNTPLLKLNHLSQKHGLPPTLAKMEMSNPTASYKDRGSAVAIQKAASLGLKRIGTVSTGNMASSTAAYAARAGLKAYVLVKEDALPEKLLAAQKILAEEEGIFCMPASATVLAALLKLSKKIKFSQDDQVVLIITGSGLRAMKVLKSVPINIQRTSLADLAQTIKAFQD